MAARSNDTTMYVFIALLGVVSLAGFVTSIVFWSKYQAADKNLTQFRAEVSDFIRDAERQNDAVLRVRDQAKKSNQSVVGYLADSMRKTMSRVTGAQNDTFEQLEQKLSSVEGAAGNNLLGVVRARDTEISSLTSARDQADQERQTALADRENEANRVRELIAGHQRTVDELNRQISGYKAEVETNRQQVNDLKAFMDAEVGKARDRAAGAESSLGEKIAKLERENLSLRDQVANLRGEQTKNILKPTAESSLADGRVIGLDQGANTVTIDRGRRDKVILGMSFAVYSSAAAIRPDDKGEYPRGKATVEVISISETSSTCRIISETQGNPIVRGDVVANAIYDPAKTYTFLVFGNFDSNNDGVATPQERDDIVAMIEGWGGKVTDELTGNVDFLVLGQRPNLPPRPTANTPLPLVQEFMRLDSIAQRYDQLFQTASQTSVPVLNENRLYTLIGRRVAGR